MAEKYSQDGKSDSGTAEERGVRSGICDRVSAVLCKEARESGVCEGVYKTR